MESEKFDGMTEAEAIWDIPEGIWNSTLSRLPRDMKNVIEKFYDNVIKD